MTDRRQPEDSMFAHYCRTGSPRALARVFDDTAPELWRVAKHLVSDPHAAEDLVQETFLVAIESRARFDPARPVLPWLLGVLANLVRQRRSSRSAAASRATTETDPAAADATPGAVDDPVASAAASEFAQSLQREVHGLPQPYRDVLIQHLEQGLGAHDIAARQGCPPSTVRNQVMRGMDLLRRSLPAGFAGGAAVASLSSTAHAAMRARVLTLAAGGSAAATGLGVTGLIAMKKTMLIAGTALAASLLLWIWAGPWQQSDTPVRADPGRLSADAALPPTEADPAAPPRTDLATTANASARTAVNSGSASPTGTVRVRLRFARDGAPAADVGVYARVVSGPALGVEHRTDQTGTAQFEGLAPGMFLVQPDRCAGARIEVQAGGQYELDIEIPPGVDVEGRVVDVARKPVAGARVLAKRLTHHDYFQHIATAGPDGRFTLRDAAPDTQLIAQAAHYQPSHHGRDGSIYAAPGSTQEIELRLGARAHRLHGEVVDERGAAVPFALVAIAVDEDARKHPNGELGQKYPSEFERPMDLEAFLLRCDGRGEFDTTSVPMGKTLVVARAAALNDPRITSAEVNVRPKTDNRVVLRLTSGAEIHGVVTDERGRGYADLPVLAEWKGTLALGNFEHHLGHLVCDRIARTDPEGRFRLVGLLAGPQEIMVGARFDDELRIDDDDALHDATVTVTDGQVLAWRAVVERRYPLRLLVLGPDELPLAGWAVHVAEHAGGVGSRHLRRHRTGGDGRCDVGDRRDRDHVLSVHAPRAQDGSPRELPTHVMRGVRPGDDEVVVRVPALPTAQLRGRVTGARGEHGRLQLRLVDWGTVDTVNPEPGDGAFVFTDLPPAAFELHYRALWAPQLVFGPFDLQPDQKLDVGDLEVPAPRRATVRLTGLAGSPPDDASVTVVRVGGAQQVPVSCTWTAGGFRSDPLAPGTYIAFAAPGAKARSHFAPAAARFELAADRDAVVSVPVTLGTPQVIEVVTPHPPAEAHADIDLWLEHGGVSHQVALGLVAGTQVGGALRLRLMLAPGKYRLRVEVAGWDPTHTQFEAPAGERAAVRVRVPSKR